MNAQVDISGLVMRIMPENVTPLWPQLEVLFLPALRMVSTHTCEDVRRSVMTMEAQLWAQMSASTVEAAATTEFVRYPVGLFLRVWLAGSRKDCRFDDDQFFDIMNRFRLQHECIGFEAIGRHGWLRRVPRAQVEGLIMRLVET